jgi:SAM-dependent methyltransferase
MGESPTPTELAERSKAYDRFHEACDIQRTHKQLRAEAWGDEFPEEVDPSSSCTWLVLGEMVGRLRLKPDAVLVDLGCGRGGTGLWLARALSARLIGLDVSPRALEISRRRVPDFLPEGRAEFREGTFERTGLPDGCADGVVSMDALPFAFDREAALVELRRILRPGARAVFTAGHPLPGHPKYVADAPTWPTWIKNAGLELEAELERPGEPGLWERLYAGLAEHEAEVRVDLGDYADVLYNEVRDFGPIVHLRAAVLYTVRAPEAK